LAVRSVIQLGVYILTVSASNVLLIDQLNPNYSSMRLDTVVFFSASSWIEFYLVFDTQLLGFSISKFGCGRSIWILNSSILVNRLSLLKYIFELHFRIFLFRCLYRLME